MLHPLEEYNNPGFFDLPLSINRNSAFIFLHVSVEIVGNAIFKKRKNAQEMYHGMPSPAVGWSSGKKPQVKAHHEIRLYPPQHSAPLLYTDLNLCLSRHAKNKPLAKMHKTDGSFLICVEY